MPLIYRSMSREGDHPKVGPSARTLGVRVPEDILAPGGFVSPRSGGMSVAPSWRDLPPWRIPIRLIHLAPKAAGRQRDVYCWRMGEGSFMEGGVANGLTLRPDDPKHGLVEPAEVMTIDHYQTALAATRDLWCIDED
jgi:hypothetical protein